MLDQNMSQRNKTNQIEGGWSEMRDSVGVYFGKIQINIAKELQKIIYGQFGLLQGKGQFKDLLNRQSLV